MSCKCCKSTTPLPPIKEENLTDEEILLRMIGDSKKEGGDDTNPKDLLGIKKVRLSLVPASSTIYQASAMENGAVKYGPFNWRTKKVRASIYIDAAKRHLDSWFDGEEFASDSKVHHLGHALACLGIIVDARETGNLIDDRPPAGSAAKLIEKLKKKD